MKAGIMAKQEIIKRSLRLCNSRAEVIDLARQDRDIREVVMADISVTSSEFLELLSVR